MKIAAIGGTGVLARHLLPRLLERGHAVRATVRREADAVRLRRLGVEPVLADILEPATLGAAVRGCEVALHLATSIPVPGGRGDWALNDRIRREGTRHLLAACRDLGVRLYLQQSIAMLQAGGDSQPQSEDSPLAPGDRLRSSVEMEEAVMASALDWRIVRGGAFYGPGTGREEQWRSELRQGRLRLPAAGEAFLSLIHVADMAAAMVAVLESTPSRQVYNCVDDEPVTYRQLFSWLAALEGAAVPEPGGASFLASFRVSNLKLRALGWAPRHSSYRSGLAG